MIAVWNRRRRSTTIPPPVPHVVGLLNELYGAMFATAMLHDQIAPLRSVFAWAARDFFDDALAGIARDMYSACGVGATLAAALDAFLREGGVDPDVVSALDGGAALQAFGNLTPTGDVDAVCRALQGLTGNENRKDLWDALAEGLRVHHDEET